MTATDLLIIVVALVVAVLGGWPLTAGVLRLAARSADAGTPGPVGDVPDEAADAPGETPDDAAPPPAAAGGDGPTGPQARSVLRGGTWIGVLERAAIAGAILAGFPTGVALVIAVKGLGRYPEIREHPGASERFVIGTLASMIWACAVAGLGRAIVLGWPG
jgi:hypothetical protein